MSSDNENNKIASDLEVLKFLMHGKVDPVWEKLLQSAADSIRTENKRANKAEMSTIVGAWGSDGKGHGLHLPSYRTGLGDGWTKAIDHVEPLLTPEQKRAAHADNPNEGSAYV